MTSRDWQPVAGFPGYSVNPLGQVRHEESGRLLQQRINQYGVPYVGMMRRDRNAPISDGTDLRYPNQQCIRSLPKLVALAFLDPPSDIFNTPIQLDGDVTNCRADNLMWRPRWYAVRYKNQFKDFPYPHPIRAEIRSLSDGRIFPNSLVTGCCYGLLEEEVVLSVLNQTPAWPTYQFFELARMA